MTLTVPEGAPVVGEPYDVGLRLVNRSDEATTVQTATTFVDVVSAAGVTVYPPEPRSPLRHGAVLGVRWVNPGSSFVATYTVEFPTSGRFTIVPSVGVSSRALSEALSDSAIVVVDVE